MARTEVVAPKESKPAARRKPGGRKKLTPFNKYMQTEMARLKEEEPNILHKDRFKLATANWKNAKENPRNTEADS